MGRRRRTAGPRAEAEIAALLPGDPQIRRFVDRPGQPRPRPTPGSPTAPLAAPLRATCDAVCPASPGHLPPRRLPARRAGTPLLAEFGTPSETLIPPETWHASPRGQKALLRVPAARFRFAYETAVAVRAEDACLADALAAEVARFYQLTAHAGRNSSATPLMQ